jgi:SAM-dependent methyltransferase
MRLSWIRQDAATQARLLAGRSPYYWNFLKALPYGATRRLTRSKCRDYGLMEGFLRNREGLEIGGPSSIFRAGKLIPVYDRCGPIDNSNFSNRTIWDPASSANQVGVSYRKQYLAEATDLREVPDQTYDFVLASHVLEHVANPMLALQDWRRVLRQGGTMLVIVPDRRANFDHRRAPTSFEHIEADFVRSTPEGDLTHVEEIVALHDLGLDPVAGSAMEFRERSLKNATIRALHHHVFTPEVLVRMFSKVGLQVLSMAIERPWHIIGFARKVGPGASDAQAENLPFLHKDAEWRKSDPLAESGRLARFGSKMIHGFLEGGL